MTILNETSLKYSVALSHGDKSELIGSIGCKSVSQVLLQSAQNKLLGVPISALERVYFNHKSSEDNIAVQFLHGENEKQVLGEIQLPPFQTFYKMSNSKSPMRTFEMVCSSIMERKEVNSKNSRMIIKVGCKVTLVDGFPFVELFLQPRLMLQNNMCINIFAKTLMPRIYKNGVSDDCSSNDDAVIYRLEPYESLEIFTPGKSVLFSFRCADAPVGDVKTGWNQPGWIELPITETLEDRIDCYFPFVTKSDEDSNFGDGSTFFIIEEHGVSEVSIPLNPQSPQLRVITVNLENLGIDHTGDFLFESFKNNSHSFTLCSFSSTFKMRRITMLPSNKKPIRLFQLSTNKRSKPLCIEDVAFADGGLDSTSIIWTDDSESGFYVYKKLSFHNEFENYPNSQMEVHIIPAIIIYNGGDHHVQVIHSGSHKSELAKGKMTPVHQSWEENGIRISILFDSLDCISSQVTISKTGVLVSVVKSLVTGTPVGSIAFQTMIGRSDSRHVIKIGPLIHGNVAGVDSAEAPKTSLFENDILRFRARWSHMKVTFLDTSKDHRDNLNDLKLEISESSPTLSSKKVTSYAKVANVVLSRFTVDYQRVFKDDVVSATLKKRTQRRSQFAVVVHNIHLKDFTENVTGTTVLASISKKTSFFDLCIRTRDKGIAGMSSIDLLELKLANDGKVSDKIILNTTEAFVWRLLDIASRTKNASETFSAVDSNIKWNPQLQIFEVEVIDGTSGNTTNEYGNYEVPRNISIYHVKRASVLPTSFILSFKRQPQASRYQNVQNIKGAKIVDYFSKKLNFTVDKAHLRFSGFNITNVKGPLDKIIDQLKAFYSHQMKSKIFALLTSTSIDEWQQLAGRDEGDRGFVEGDILRTAGNLTGKSAGFIVKKVGQGINVGLTAATAEVGDGIQQMSEAIGVGAVGAGVNSVLNGIGGGVGSTVQGGKFSHRIIYHTLI
jgi:vacuolar protein sorting-associated protein 13A/C